MKPFNRLLSLLLGLALLAGGVLAVAEAVAAAAGRGPLLVPVARWLGDLGGTAFDARAARLVFAALALVGLVMAVLELRPWARRRVALAVGGPGAWWVLRRSLERGLSHDLVSGTPARRVVTRLKPKASGWRLRVSADAADDDAPEIAEQAREFLARVGAPKGSTIRTRTRNSKAVA